MWRLLGGRPWLTLVGFQWPPADTKLARLRSPDWQPRCEQTLHTDVETHGMDVKAVGAIDASEAADDVHDATNEGEVDAAARRRHGRGRRGHVAHGRRHQRGASGDGRAVSAGGTDGGHVAEACDDEQLLQRRLRTNDALREAGASGASGLGGAVVGLRVHNDGAAKDGVQASEGLIEVSVGRAEA